MINIVNIDIDIDDHGSESIGRTETQREGRGVGYKLSILTNYCVDDVSLLKLIVHESIILKTRISNEWNITQI